jgi:hypothetical protein
MYFASIVLLMLVLPLTSIGIQSLIGGSGVLTAALVAKWFIFWMVGARLLVAGLRQIAQPDTRPKTFWVYALAGINHVTSNHRNKLQNFAMVSDLFAAAVLLMSCLAAWA